MDNIYLHVSRFPVNQLTGQCTAALYRYSVHFQALAMYIHISKGSKGILAIGKSEEYMPYNII